MSSLANFERVLESSFRSTLEEIDGVWQRKDIHRAYTDSFGFQWNQFRRTQFDSQTNTGKNRRMILGGTGWEDLKDKFVL